MTTSESGAFTCFQNLGLPDTITAEDYEKMSKGVFGEALSLVARHILGRSQVVKRRRIGEELKERTNLDEAQLRVNKAQLSLQTYERESGDKIDVLVNLEGEAKLLQAQVQHEKRVGMLLDALQEREEARLRRLQELNRIIHSMQNNPVFSTTPPDTSIPCVEERRSALVLHSHTADALSSIFAHQIRLRRNSSITPKGLLVNSVMQHLDVPQTQAEVLADTLIAGYRLQLRRTRTQQKGQSNSESLNQLSIAIGKKEQELQTLSNQTLALLHACDFYFGAISHHCSGISAELRVCLEQAVQESKGYLDALISQVLGLKRSQIHEDEFMAAVKKTLKLRGTVNTQAILEKIEGLARSQNQMGRFSAYTTLEPHSPQEVKIVRDYLTTAESVERNSSSLLSRKLAKVEKGLVVLQDVGALLEAHTNAKNLLLL